MSGWLPRLGDARGFTLIETLVAMVTGIVVIGATYAILEISLKQNVRLQDVAQATQLGRTSMTRITDRLHSACLAPKFTPVQAGSTESKLIFIDAYSEEAQIASARRDEIVFNAATKTLIDFTYASTGGEWPEFKFASTPTPTAGTLIGEDITQSEEGKGEKSVKIPIFKYYSYAKTSTTSSTAASSTLNESEPLSGAAKTEGLTAKEAATAASVLVSFRAGPTSGSSESTRTVDERDQATFAFGAPNAEATIQDAPCQ